MSLDAKDANYKAIRYLMEIMPRVGDSKDIRLEEVEFDKENNFWALTYSYPDPDEPTYFAGLTPFGVRRQAKVIRVNADDGSFVALKQFVA